MNKTITCFIPYGSENQINKTIRHLQECPTVDRIFLLPTSPVPNLSLPDKCYILPSSAPESVLDLLAYNISWESKELT